MSPCWTLLEERQRSVGHHLLLLPPGNRGSGGAIDRPAGIPTLAYHAGLDAHTRRLTQERFIDGEVPIVAATIAFGMGIDKPDIRLGGPLHSAQVHRGLLPGNRTGRPRRADQRLRPVLQRGRPAPSTISSSGRITDGDLYHAALAERQLQQMVDYGRLTSPAGAGISCPILRRRGGGRRLRQLRRLPGGAASGGRHGSSPKVTVRGDTHWRAVRHRPRKPAMYCWAASTAANQGSWNTTSSPSSASSNDYDRNGLRRIAEGLIEKGLLHRTDAQYPTVSVTAIGREWLQSRQSLSLDLRVDESANQRKRPKERIAGGVSSGCGHAGL